MVACMAEELVGCCTDMAEAICVGGAARVEVGAGALLKVKGPPEGALTEPAHPKLLYLLTGTWLPSTSGRSFMHVYTLVMSKASKGC